MPVIVTSELSSSTPIAVPEALAVAVTWSMVGLEPPSLPTPTAVLLLPLVTAVATARVMVGADEALRTAVAAESTPVAPPTCAVTSVIRTEESWLDTPRTSHRGSVPVAVAVTCSSENEPPRCCWSRSRSG
ncbi:MAG: hypothetical protein JWN08_3839 [Frankiales bacterium]|nr:hypothetical protein [Frankiales bacterium]